MPRTCLKNVAAGVSPAVEGGILPPGDTANSSRRWGFSRVSAGQDAQLGGRRDACMATRSRARSYGRKLTQLLSLVAGLLVAGQAIANGRSPELEESPL